MYCTTVLETIVTVVRERLGLSPELHPTSCSLGNQELSKPCKPSPTVTHHTQYMLKTKSKRPCLH